MLRDLVNRVFDGSPAAVMVNLLEDAELDEDRGPRTAGDSESQDGGGTQMKTILDPELCWRVLLDPRALPVAGRGDRPDRRGRGVDAAPRLGAGALRGLGGGVVVDDAVPGRDVCPFVGSERTSRRCWPRFRRQRAPPCRPRCRRLHAAGRERCGPASGGDGAVVRRTALRESPDWKRFAPHVTTVYLLGVALMFGRLAAGAERGGAPAPGLRAGD